MCSGLTVVGIVGHTGSSKLFTLGSELAREVGGKEGTVIVEEEVLEKDNKSEICFWRLDSRVFRAEEVEALS